MTIPGPPPSPFDGLTRALTNMTEALAALSLIPPIPTGLTALIPTEGWTTEEAIGPIAAELHAEAAEPTPGRFRNLL